MLRKEIDEIWEQVRDNHIILDTCNYHEFKRVSELNKLPLMNGVSALQSRWTPIIFRRAHCA